MCRKYITVNRWRIQNLASGTRPRPNSVPSGILIHPAVWPQRTWAENQGTVPLFGGAGSPSNTMWPGLRPTSVPSCNLIHRTVWPQ